VGQRGHSKSWGLYFFQLKRKRKSSIGKRIFVHYKRVTAIKRAICVAIGCHIYI
jgi:hypothetical protein